MISGVCFFLGAPDQDDDILQVLEEDVGSSQQLESKKRKIDGEIDGGISKKLRTEDVIVVI
jgi:hypothetical protein